MTSNVSAVSTNHEQNHNSAGGGNATDSAKDAVNRSPAKRFAIMTMSEENYRMMWQVLEIVVVVTVIGIAVGLLLIPVIFFYLPMVSKLNKILYKICYQGHVCS